MKKEKLEEKLIKFIEIEGESVTIPKNIFNEFLTSYMKTIENYETVLNLSDSEMDKLVLKRIVDNPNNFGWQIFYLMANHAFDLEKIINDLHIKYDDEEILIMCAKILVSLNVVNRCYGNQQFTINDLSDKEKLYEHDLEKFLIKDNNIELIEKGLKVIRNQAPYKDENNDICSSIDILAEDSNGRICVIELKTEKNDSRLLYQCMAYPNQYDNCRMIVVAPDYTKTILKELNKLDYVEKYIYKIEGKDLNTLTIEKL